MALLAIQFPPRQLVGMHSLYLASVFLHIAAAMTWIGGMFFLVLVVVPWLRRGDRAQASLVMRETGQRFRNVGWACFAIVLVTGTFNLYIRGVRPGDFLRSEWLASPFGKAVVWKLSIFALVLTMSAVHDFWHGPRATLVGRDNPRSPEAERLRRQASMMGRVNMVFALALLGLGVVLVRGWPW